MKLEAGRRPLTGTAVAPPNAEAEASTRSLLDHGVCQCFPNRAAVFACTPFSEPYGALHSSLDRFKGASFHGSRNLLLRPAAVLCSCWLRYSKEES